MNIPRALLAFIHSCIYTYICMCMYTHMNIPRPPKVYSQYCPVLAPNFCSGVQSAQFLLTFPRNLQHPSVCMYIYIYICIQPKSSYTYIHTYIYTHAQVYIYGSFMYVCMYLCIHVCMYVYMYTSSSYLTE